MALRFFRRVGLGPGLTLNLSKRGVSLSGGPRGAKLTAGTSGVRRTVGLPGTGLRYTEHSSGKDRQRGGPARSEAPSAAGQLAEERLDLGFFRRLFTPQEEEDLVDGMRQLALGRPRKALEHLRRATQLADAAFMAGILALEQRRHDEAIEHLREAERNRRQLSQHLRRYGIAATVRLPVTPRISAEIGPDMRGLRLALAEAHQARGEVQPALEQLERLHRSDELLRAIRYERAVAYEALGHKKRARQELERIYAEAPDDEDVAQRLGIE